MINIFLQYVILQTVEFKISCHVNLKKRKIMQIFYENKKIIKVYKDFLKLLSSNNLKM